MTDIINWLSQHKEISLPLALVLALAIIRGIWELVKYFRPSPQKTAQPPPTTKSNRNVTTDHNVGTQPIHTGTGDMHVTINTPENEPLRPQPKPSPTHPLLKIPFQANERFKGRQKQLYNLKQQLVEEQSATVITQAISGQGGVGKTQLACQFAFENRTAYPGGIFWLDCVDEQTTLNSFIECGYEDWLNLYKIDSKLDPEQKATLVKHYFEQENKCLLVFDNCEDPKLIQRWRPQQGGASILITSRFKDWQALSINVIKLDILPRKESVLLLQSYRDDLSSVPADLDKIAYYLGYLPLALHLAGCYLLQQRHLTAHEYLEALEGVRL